MIIKLDNFAAIGVGAVVSARCPRCRQMGTLESLPNVHDVQAHPYMLGQRRCPNPVCHTHLFFVWSPPQNRLLASYPAERIDFDTTNVPEQVKQALEEAIICHAAGCHRAAAIMVRRTLEDLCRDRGANGNNLKDRIKALQTRVVLPQELLDAMDDLRLLGNDAAHIESQEYNAVGQAEVEVAIAVSKEILKAVYQYSALVTQLRALKKSP